MSDPTPLEREDEQPTPDVTAEDITVEEYLEFMEFIAAVLDTHPKQQDKATEPPPAEDYDPDLDRVYQEYLNEIMPCYSDYHLDS